MRINEETILVGDKVLLVPYRREHVQQYNTWMQSPHLQEATASEPLTLEEEYQMQHSWWLDADKLTFIILHLDRTTILGDGADGEGSDGDDALRAMSTEELVNRCRMAGDVNVFLTPVEQDEEGERHDDGNGVEKGSTNTTAAAATLAGKEEITTFQQWRGELEIMIAEPSLRRHHLALEALQLLLWYITSCPTPLPTSPPSTPSSLITQKTMTCSSPSSSSLPLLAQNLFCKINEDNHPSLCLFQSPPLNFKVRKISAIWKEVELVLDPTTTTTTTTTMRMGMIPTVASNPQSTHPHTPWAKEPRLIRRWLRTDATQER